jgi:hypothetical protein
MDPFKALALLYVLAQSVERIVELFSELRIWGDPTSKDPGEKRKRAIWLWAAASLLGWGLCLLFEVDFISMLTNSTRHPILRLLLSGIIVGSGTKPVHDVITTLEKHAVGKSGDAMK